MPAYAVKHVVEDHGPLSKIMKEVRSRPYSFTSNEPEASAASSGGDVFVVEVHALAGGRRSYRLGYKYRAYEKDSPAGGGLWRDRFKYRNAARPIGQAEGAYFDSPVEIADSDSLTWLRAGPLGMVELPPDVERVLEAIIANPANAAKGYAAPRGLKTSRWHRGSDA